MILLYIIESTLSARIACFFLFQKSPKSPKVPKLVFRSIRKHEREARSNGHASLFCFSRIILYLNSSASFSPSFSPRISSFMATILPLASTM